MNKKFRKLLSGMIAVSMLASSMAVTVNAVKTSPEPKESVDYYLNEDNIVYKVNIENYGYINGYKSNEYLNLSLKQVNIGVVVPEDVEVNNEYLGLPDNYTIAEPSSLYDYIQGNYDLNGKKLYLIKGDDLEDESNISKIKDLMIYDKIESAVEWESYECDLWAYPHLLITLKTADENFSIDDFEILKGKQFEKLESDDLTYGVDIGDIDITKFEEMIKSVESYENVQSAEVTLLSDLLGRSKVKIRDIRIDGDSNSDNRLNVRDCSFIAQKLAQKKADELPEYSDYNLDGKVDVRDAAGVAKYLAAKK